ncbi:MAG: hypothetical protein Q7R56_01075, partial [Nanoarchaeota archaeon]|nr:hypothetical protein [Nanoarchaeota archaeon]
GKTIRTTFSKGGTILEKKDLVITKDTEEFSITINQQINQFSIKVAYTVIKSTTPQQTSTTGTTTLTETYTTPEGITFILPVGTILPPGSSIGGTTFTGNPLLTPFEVLPGGTIPAGTILPAGTVLPAGIQQPGTNQNKVTIIIEDHLKRQRSFTLDLQQKCNLGTSRTKIVPELGKQITVTATLAPPSFIPGEDIKKNFDQALSNYKEVQRLTENTPNNELARQAQERIVSIYETLSTNNLEGGIFDHLDELDELEASTTDETQKRVLQIKRNVYTVIKQQCVGKPELIDDNGILLSVVPYSYQPRHDEEAIATLKYSATNQLQKVKTGDYLTTPDGKLWTIKQINTNNITLERLNQETTQYDYQDITQQQGYCIQNAINQQQKDCITLVNIEAGKEVYITIQPDTDKAKTVSQFNVHLNIDKRAFNLPLFSKNIDEEINNTEKLLEKLTKIVDNAKKLHAFWTKFCFITFGVLWTTSFLENTLGGSKENIARGKITDQWHQKYQDQAGKPNGIKDYDKFIFANQEAYENDLEKATKIIDDINNDRYTNALPKGLTEEQRKSDEAKDYYFYKKMAEDQ